MGPEKMDRTHVREVGAFETPLTTCSRVDDILTYLQSRLPTYISFVSLLALL